MGRSHHRVADRRKDVQAHVGQEAVPDFHSPRAISQHRTAQRRTTQAERAFVGSRPLARDPSCPSIDTDVHQLYRLANAKSVKRRVRALTLLSS
jgi:hypothetical protein